MMGAADFLLQTMEGETRKIDLNTELFVRNNFAIAKLVIIVGLLKNDDRQIPLILKISLNKIINELLLNLGAVLQLPITQMI